MAVQAAVIAELRAVNAGLVVANAEQAHLIATLQARVAELERRLGQDSSNSSKPPSSDGLRKPARVERRAAERAEDRRPGKQPGAPGAHLAQVEEPDEVAWHVPDRCGGCGAELTDARVVGVEARQVFDLPRLRLGVVEHRTRRRRCACGTTTAAAFPAHVQAAACYGPGMRALVAYLCTSTCRWTGPRSCWPTCSARRWPPAPWPPWWPRAPGDWTASSRSCAHGWPPRRWPTSMRPVPGSRGGCTGSTRPPLRA